MDSAAGVCSPPIQSAWYPCYIERGYRDEAKLWLNKEGKLYLQEGELAK